MDCLCDKIVPLTSEIALALRRIQQVLVEIERLARDVPNQEPGSAESPPKADPDS